MQLMQFKKALFEKNKLSINENITLDEWAELGRQLQYVEGSVQFWIGDWARFGDKKGFMRKYTDSKVYDELEEITGLKRQTIQDFKSIAERTSSLRNEDLTFNHHREVAKLSPEQQVQFLNKASEEKLSVRELRDEVRKSEIQKIPVEIPAGKYTVIYSDPPWRYDFSETTTREIENQYPTMDVEEIKAMEIPAHEDSVLFLWATAPKLREALEVMEAWKFEYKTHAIWDKGKIGMGYWFRGQHELLLIGTKGNVSPPLPADRISSVITETRGNHSVKPDLHELIEKMCRNGNYLELFARGEPPNKSWTFWGNQTK